MKRYFRKSIPSTILVIVIIVVASFVFTVQPSLAAVSQAVNKRFGLDPYLNPPFRLCDTDPKSPQYSVLARYVVEGTAGSANLTKSLIGQGDMNITITNNMTGLSGKLLSQSAPTQTLAGNLQIKPPTQLGGFNIKAVSTECIGYSGPRRFPPNPDIFQSIQINPPFRECGLHSNSTTYTIASVFNQTQILNNVSPLTEIKITIVSNFLTGGLSGNLLIGQNKPINLNINAIETICKSSAI